MFRNFRWRIKLKSNSGFWNNFAYISHDFRVVLAWKVTRGFRSSSNFGQKHHAFHWNTNLSEIDFFVLIVSLSKLNDFEARGLFRFNAKYSGSMIKSRKNKTNSSYLLLACWKCTCLDLVFFECYRNFLVHFSNKPD